MKIEWFPGHMATATKEAAETMRTTDVVVEVLDARVPYSSCNPVVEKLRRQNQRPALKVLNKQDAADPVRTRQWLDHYNAQPGVKAVALCAPRGAEVARIPGLCSQLAPGRGTPLKPLRIMILGVPNVGKSTLMNSLLKRHVANVGDEPAITRMQMRHAVSPGVWIVDTPGMTWSGMTPDVGLKLAAAHSIGRNAYDQEFVALDLAAYLLTAYPALLEARLGALPVPATPEALLAHVASVRSLVAKGGGPNLPQAAQTFLTDFRTGALGAITLETVEEVAARQAAARAAPAKRRRS